MQLRTRHVTNNKRLLALSTAAMALPGMGPQSVTAQDAMSQDKSISYRFNSYSEDNVPSSKLWNADSSSPRYTIDTHQLNFTSPITRSTQLALKVMAESMTGASPRFVRPQFDDNDVLQPKIVMSGATIDEKRTDLDINFTTWKDKGISSTGISYSTEHDYSSVGARTKHTWFFNEKNTSFELGASVSQDFIEARQIDDEKTSASVTVGLSQIIDKSSIVSSSLNFASYNGYLSDPYKEVWVTGGTGIIADARPDSRNQWAWSTSYRKHFEKLNSSLHADYRLFGNDWDTLSHTLDLRWLYEFGDGWVVTPSLRYYQQSRAEFFQNWYESIPADGYVSSDYRLSDYNANSLRLKITKKLDFGALHLSMEKYTSSSSTNTPIFSSPALVDFSYITIGLDLRI